MRHVTEEEFIELFLDLESWKVRYKKKPQIGLYDNFVRICLSIARELINDERFMRAVSRELSLIIGKEQNLIVDLDEPFIGSEIGFEENLRGFKNLFNWVLEDNVIRRDPEVLLGRVPGLLMGVRSALKQLSSELFIYFDLDDAFSLNAPRVEVVLFLQAVSEIFDELMGSVPLSGRQVMTTWLTQRIKNQGLKSFLEDAWKKTGSKELSGVSGLQAKELWILTICKRAASHPCIGKAEEPIWEVALKELGMFGLMPLVESGIFSLEEEKHAYEPLEKSPFRLFRIK